MVLFLFSAFFAHVLMPQYQHKASKSTASVTRSALSSCSSASGQAVGATVQPCSVPKASDTTDSTHVGQRVHPLLCRTLGQAVLLWVGMGRGEASSSPHKVTTQFFSLAWPCAYTGVIQSLSPRPTSPSRSTSPPPSHMLLS